MRWALPVVVGIAAVAVMSFVLAGRTSPDAGITFAWEGEAGEPIELGVFTQVVRREGIQEQSIAKLAATADDGGERQLVITGRRNDGEAMVAHGTTRRDRLVIMGSFVPVADLDAQRVWPKGVHPLGGWDANREVVADRAIIRFEAGGGPRPDRVGWVSVVGIVRSDVRRIVAELADGSRRELTLNRWRGFGYRSAPGSAALVLQAYDGEGALLERAELGRAGPLCGVDAGPCDAVLAQYLD
jgi:hypothetical protein